MLRCREAAMLLSAAEDRRLPVMDRLQLKFHVAICGACKNFGKQLKWVRHYANQYAQGDVKQADKAKVP